MGGQKKNGIWEGGDPILWLVLHPATSIILSSSQSDSEPFFFGFKRIVLVVVNDTPRPQNWLLFYSKSIGWKTRIYDNQTEKGNKWSDHLENNSIMEKIMMNE